MTQQEPENTSLPDPPERWVHLHGDAPFRYAFLRVRRGDVAEDLVQETFLAGARRVIREHGSLEACFAAGISSEHKTILPAMQAFAGELASAGGGSCGHLLPNVASGSACKRLNLMLRWLVRCDEVDPGGWRAVPPAMLIVPLDTHIHRIALALGATQRKAPGMPAALDITAAFRRIAPADPTRYDFALTRLGIRRDMSLPAFLEACADMQKAM